MKFTTATVTNAAMIGLLPASRTGLDVAVRQGVRRTGANLLAPLDIRRTRIYAQQPTRKNKYSGAERIWAAKLPPRLYYSSFTHRSETPYCTGTETNEWAPSAEILRQAILVFCADSEALIK